MKWSTIVMGFARETMKPPVRRTRLGVEIWGTNHAHEAPGIRASSIEGILSSRWSRAFSLFDTISETYSSIELMVPWMSIPFCCTAE
ncbi:uncharacterized protein N7459_001053 [Penicillium hispanicum]|uniref:uncharacterized protein n=1 Tax=Penicillium hispanicum TaxID=1080232 RepID=UPI0025421BA2|nr:uncharacterized protein N7459_001053 [Penicillium hispanicum]KAJ5594845.1 hypothetical protein N7459_001053 [Penicillium hispanicum]